MEKRGGLDINKQCLWLSRAALDRHFSIGDMALLVGASLFSLCAARVGPQGSRCARRERVRGPGFSCARVLTRNVITQNWQIGTFLQSSSALACVSSLPRSRRRRQKRPSEGSHIHATGAKQIEKKKIKGSEGASRFLHRTRALAPQAASHGK